MRVQYTRWAVIAMAFVFAIDQITKQLAAHTAHNPAYALGIVQAPSGVLVLGSLLGLVVFVWLVARWAVQIGVPAALPGIVAGGMLGNVVDRARYGSVRDFIATPVAIINVADIAVMIGLAALMLAVVVRVIALRRVPSL
jgi:lipoprotein signal peptidase